MRRRSCLKQGVSCLRTPHLQLLSFSAERRATKRVSPNFTCFMEIHRQLDNSRWRTYSLAFQLGSVGAEVSRFLNWQRKGDRAQTEKALARALELLDATIADKRWKKNLGELLRLRELVSSKVFAPEMYQVTDKQLEQYFLPFAILARK